MKLSFLPLFLLLCLAVTGFSRPALTLCAAYGYTGYHPDDLNEVNRIFEETSRAVGFKGYTVKTFSGHPEQMVGLGLQWTRLSVSAEAEIWEEKFSQRNVHFVHDDLAGSVNADEDYLFIPVCVMFKYPFAWKKFLITPGYGPGIMFGSATVNMSTVYDSLKPSDNMVLDFTSGFNIIHRFCLEAFYRPLPWLAAGLSGGYRFSTIPYLEVSKKTGNSYIFNLLFNGGADEGDRLYTGNENLSFIQESEKRSFHHLVQGNMTGYYVWLKVLFILGAKK